MGRRLNHRGENFPNAPTATASHGAVSKVGVPLEIRRRARHAPPPLRSGSPPHQPISASTQPSTTSVG
jgi:hypothetical protein